MNILLINHYAGSPEMGMEYRPFYLARHWVRMGHKVTVIAASYSHLRLQNPIVEGRTQRQSIDGVDYLFIRTCPYQGNGRQRVQNTLQFVAGLRRLADKLAEELAPDLVIASSTHPFDWAPARRIAEQSKQSGGSGRSGGAGAKLVFELHDVWPQSLMELHDFPASHPLMRLIQREEDRALRGADLVVSLLPFVEDYAKERGYSLKKFLYLPNGAEVSAVGTAHPPQRHLDLLEKYRGKGRFLVLYVGGFSAANALEDFVQAAGKAGRDFLFAAVGSGPLKQQLRRMARIGGIHNLLFLDGVGREALPRLLAQADCLYIGGKKLDIYRYGVSMNKLFDYMLAAKPIIYGVEAANNPVEEAGCGLTIPSQSADAIVGAARTLREMPPEQRAEMGRRGRAYLEQHHDYRHLAQQFLAAAEGIEPQAAPRKKKAAGGLFKGSAKPKRKKNNPERKS